MAKRLAGWFHSPRMAQAALAMSVFALTIAFIAGTVALRSTQQNGVFLRSVLCDIVQPYSQGSKTTPPTTPQAQKLAKSFDNAETNLQCSPDPFDGK